MRVKRSDWRIYSLAFDVLKDLFSAIKNAENFEIVLNTYRATKSEITDVMSAAIQNVSDVGERFTRLLNDEFICDIAHDGTVSFEPACKYKLTDFGEQMLSEYMKESPYVANGSALDISGVS